MQLVKEKYVAMATLQQGGYYRAEGSCELETADCWVVSCHQWNKKRDGSNVIKEDDPATIATKGKVWIICSLNRITACNSSGDIEK